MFKKNLNAHQGFHHSRFVLPQNATTLQTENTSLSLSARAGVSEDRHCPLLHTTCAFYYIAQKKGITMKDPRLFIMFA